MRIGIDAKWFFQGPPSGRLVVQNLIVNMLEKDTSSEFFIFLDSNCRFKNFPHQGSNVKLVYLWGSNNLISNLFIFPIIAFKYKLDACIFQNFVPVLSNFKRVAFIHDFIFLSNPEYFTIKERVYLYPIRVLANFAHRICTVSNSEKTRISKYLPAKSNCIDVVYNGISKSFRPKQFHKLSVINEVKAKYLLPEKFLLYVGRLNERKNIKNLILALAKLDNIDIPLVIVGSHDNKMFNIIKLTTDLKISDRVHLTGFVPDEHLCVLYSLATIFCFPSFEEGFGLPPLEAMASGVPAIVSNRSSLPEVCGQAGVYVNPDSVENISIAIDELLRNPYYYSSKKEQGLQWVTNFSWQTSAAKLLDSVTHTIEA